jgi:spore coat protein H
MRKRFAVGLVIAVCWAIPVVAAETKEAPPKDADELFGLDKVWTFHLQVSAKDWETMEPKGGGFGMPARPPQPGGGAGAPGARPAPGGPGGGPGGRPPGDGGFAPGKFGYEFTYVKGTLEAFGKSYKDVGVRFKGNSSYALSSRGLKRPFKIDFNRYEEKQFLGLTMINLSNNAMDSTQVREALSYAVFRAAGVPAPRTTFVRLYLTIPGKHDRQFLGLYTLIEQVNGPFLKDRFGSNKGLLVKPEGVRGLPYLGDKWSAYEDRFRPKKKPSSQAADRMIAFAKLVNNADDAAFRKQIDQFLDVDEFLRFIAVNAVLANLDSFIGLGHNYYLYLNPKDNRFVFIPWDLNLSFGGFMMMGGGDDQLQMSIRKPYMAPNRLIERVLAMKEHEATCRKHFEKLTTGAFRPEKLHTTIDLVQKAIKASLDEEAKANRGTGGMGFGPMFGRALDLKTFVTRRTESVVAQLAGKSEGRELRGIGFGGPGGGPGGGGFGMGAFLARPVLEAADTDNDGKLSLGELRSAVKKFFKECDKDKKDSLDEKMLAAGINRVLPRPPGFGGPPPGGGPGRPPGGGPGGPGRPGAPPPGGGFGMGNFYAGAIIRLADANKDGKVTLDELLAAAEKLFKEVDTSKDGKLNEKELGEGLNRLFAPPPGFGRPPGGGPGGFGPGMFLTRPVLDAADTDKDNKLSLDEVQSAVKKFFKECDKDKKDSLDEKAIAAGINRLLPPPPGFGGPPPGGGPGRPPGGGPGGAPPPGGFGPGNFYAGAIIRLADANKDSKVTRDELLAAAEKLFKEVDANKDGKLDEKELGEGLNRLFAPPPGFGRPPGPPPEGPGPGTPEKPKKEEGK